MHIEAQSTNNNIVTTITYSVIKNESMKALMFIKL
jgi:hypothetical protein